MIDEVTPVLGLPLPHPSNDLADDVVRLRQAFATLESAIAAKASAADITAAINGLIGTAPEALNQLAELAEAIGDDPNFAATVAAQIAAGIAASMPVDRKASPTVLGGIKIGPGLVIDSEGVASVPSAASTTQTFVDAPFTATAGQTVFSVPGGYVVGLLDVLLNGVVLNGGGDDYTANNGSTVVLSVGAATGDLIKIRKWSQFQSTSYYTKTEVDAVLQRSNGKMFYFGSM